MTSSCLVVHHGCVTFCSGGVTVGYDTVVIDAEVASAAIIGSAPIGGGGIGV